MHYGWIDSWWYGERLHRGVSLWEDITTRPPDFSDMRQRFPSSLTGMTRKTGRKVVAHIGAWNVDSPYARHASNCFVAQGSHTLPTSHSFWQELMGNAADWGLCINGTGSGPPRAAAILTIDSCRQALVFRKALVKAFGHGYSIYYVLCFLCLAASELRRELLSTRSRAVSKGVHRRGEQFTNRARQRYGG